MEPRQETGERVPAITTTQGWGPNRSQDEGLPIHRLSAVQQEPKLVTEVKTAERNSVAMLGARVREDPVYYGSPDGKLLAELLRIGPDVPSVVQEPCPSKVGRWREGGHALHDGTPNCAVATSSKLVAAVDHPFPKMSIPDPCVAQNGSPRAPYKQRG